MRQFFPILLALVLAATGAETRADEAGDAHKLGVEAVQHLGKKQYDEALKLASQAVRLDAKSPWLHGLVGAAHWNLKQYSAGLKECETAIRLAGGKEDAWFLHMAGENALGSLDFPLARKHFQQAIVRGEKELGGNFAIANVRLAELTAKTLAFEWVLKPGTATAFKRDDGTFLIPIPSAKHPFQTVDKMIVTGAASYKAEDFEGNEALAIRPEGDRPIRIQFRVALTPYGYKEELAKCRRDAAFPEEVKKYLDKSEWLDPTSPKLLEIVKPLRRDSPVETVEQILAYLRGQLAFAPGSKFKSADDVLEQRKAVCFGWSAAFVGLCRAAGIPARMVDVLAAYPYDGKSAPDELEAHTYGEFYVSGAGWIPVDPQPGGIVGVPQSGCVRLYHYAMNRKWAGRNADEIHPLCTLFHLGVTKTKFIFIEGADARTTADPPLQNFTPEALAGAVKLRDSLAGTVWVYRWRDKETEFAFGKSGDLQLLETWKDARWRVISANEVIVDATRGDHILLRFDGKIQEFKTKDWDGQAATGRRTEKKIEK
jgi:tetratricopeptide (TPR) repeat protein